MTVSKQKGLLATTDIPGRSYFVYVYLVAQISFEICEELFHYPTPYSP